MAQADQQPAATPASGVPADPPIDLTDRIPEFANWLPDPVRPYWDIIAQYPIVGAAVIGVLFLVAAYVVRSLVLQSVHSLASRTETDLDDAIVTLVRGPIFNTVFLFGLTLATQAARLPAGTSTVVNMLLSVVVINWLSAGFPLCGLLFQALSRNRHRFPLVQERTIPLFDIIAKLALLLVGSYILLAIWGINPAGWLASAGIVGIAVGFAAKDTLANLFSGFFIVADAPYKIGDYVNLDSGERGRVTALGMRSTRLLTRDDVEITVPNAVIANAKIVNESGGPSAKMRVRIKVGAAYGSDVDKVCEVLLATANAHRMVCDNPAARVRMRAFGASSLDFELLCWIDLPEDRGRVSHDLYMDIYKAFAREGIEIPYAKRDVYIKEMAAPTSTDS